MHLSAPKIDDRSREQIVRETEELAQTLTGWRPPGDGRPDAGRALIRIFGRLTELVIERLNRVPDKNFLAFLDLIGARLMPPQPARVPLTFSLAAGSPVDAFVPRGTQVATAAAEGEGDPILFETSRDLVVTSAQMTSVLVQEPGRDCYGDYADDARGDTPGWFPAFAGDRPIEHSIYIARDDFLGLSVPKELTLTVRSPDAAWLAALPIAWSCWDGAAWQMLSPSPSIAQGLRVAVDQEAGQITVAPGSAEDGEGRRIELANAATVPILEDHYGQTVLVVVSYDAGLSAPALEIVLEAEAADYPSETHVQLARLDIGPDGGATELFGSESAQGQWVVRIGSMPAPAARETGGVSAGWLRGSLENSMVVDAGRAGKVVRRQAVPLDAAMTDREPVELSRPFDPFGEAEAPTVFHLSVEEAFVRAGDTVNLDVSVVRSGRASSSLTLVWDFWNGRAWQVLGRPGPDRSLVGTAGAAFGFADETLALTRDGQVNFTVPRGWQATSVPRGQQARRWLRVQVGTGDYGTGSLLRPPQVESITASYQSKLPAIERVTASIRVHRTDLPPDVGFAGGSPIDLSKDFFPFGERPRLSDTLFIESREALANPGAVVTVSLALSNPNPGQTQVDWDNPPAPPVPVVASADLVIAWEVWAGTRWQEVGRSSRDSRALDGSSQGFADRTRALTRNGRVTLTVPAEVQEGTVNGEVGYWLRARIAKGNYGTAARYSKVTIDPVAEGGQSTTAYQPVPATFAPPSVASLSLEYVYAPSGPPSSCLSYNDFAYTDRTEDATHRRSVYEPFTPTEETRPALYLGFDRPFANRATTLYARVEPPLFGEGPGGDTAEGAPARVAWEYLGESGWTNLGAQDDTGAFRERGPVRFIGPANFQSSSQFGRTAHWVRARWESGEYPLLPRMGAVLANTVWADHSASTENEVLGSSTGDPDQLFRTMAAPVLEGQRIEVQEPTMPSETERAALEGEQGKAAIHAVLDASGQPVEIWARWHEVPDFHGSGPRDRHYVLNRMEGEVRFGDGLNGMVPPRGRGNVRAAAYRIGGGARGNRATGTITQLKSSVPYVDSVTNYEPAAGGAD